jgi:chromosome segregation protein
VKLTRLELLGFKSFLNRTAFQFDHGVTAIVGPNGCGKSNVVDAFIWASGERGTKSLRVKDMGDVIFHGSNGKRPVNIAEVALELSDGDKDFVVKRRIYRDGLNEYYLNGNLVRLKDIQDFFLGTGIGLNSYAIVEQGKIEHFIQMKPQERRVVIEETSGITRFEEKKREAIMRLEEVKANLERVEDIYGEVTGSLGKAEVEWERWKTYKSLADQQAEVDSMILVDGYTKLTRKLGKTKERREGLDDEILKKEEEREGIKKELLAKEEEFSLTETITRQLEVDIKGKEKDMESRLLEIEYLEEEGKRLEQEIRELAEGRGELEKQIVKYQEEIKALKDEQSKTRTLLSDSEAEADRLKSVLEESRTRTEGLEKSLEEERVKLFVEMSAIADIKNRISEIERAERERERRKQKRAEERERFRERLAALDTRLKGHEAVLQKERQARESLISERDRAFARKENLGDEIGDKRRAVEMLRAEKRGKEEFLKQMSSYREEGTEKIPGGRKLIDIIKTEGREKALEHFFSREMKYYVITDRDSASLAEAVKQHGENFIFFPERGIFSFNGQEVEIRAQWIGDIEEGLERIGKGEEGVFINDDVFIDSRGLILQERAEKRVDIKQFRETKRLEKELKVAEASLGKLAAAMKGIESEYQTGEAIYRRLKADVESKEEAVKRIEKEVVVVQAERKTIQERLGELEMETDLFGPAPADKITDLAAKREKHDLERESIEGRIASLKQSHDSTKREYESLSTKWHESTIDAERKRGRLKTMREDVERKEGLIRLSQEDTRKKQEKAETIGKEILGRSTKREGLEEDYEKLKVACQRDIERYEELKRASGNIHMEKRAIEERIELAAKEMEKLRSRRENLETETAVIAEKLETIVERLNSAYGITNPEEVPVPATGNLEAEREKIVAALSELGEVNFRAEKEYEELKERAVFLENQKEDLKNAMDSLKKTIIKIDGLSKEIFLETFDIVNEAFKRFTGILFKGGRGYLSFNQDIAGVDMFVQPPGKKTTRMELLSGGEKTLISLSLLLSLMDTKPSPFSLMDEIDAPLDDANLMALMEIIKIISSKTQIVLITHNRITMESSHAIYGVTMEEEGISKVVSVKL